MRFSTNLPSRRDRAENRQSQRKLHGPAPIIRLITLIVVSWILMASSGHAKIRLSQSNVGVTAAPLWVATSYGLFKKYGLDVEPVFVRNSTIQMMALTTGEVQLSHTGGAPTLNAVAAGHDLKIVATFGQGVYWDIVTKPGIKAPEDLRGKELGVTNIGGTTWIGAILGLEHFGLNPERDRIKLQSIGDQTVLVQSLTSGRVDAILVEPSFSRDLRKKGFRVLAELANAKLPFASSGLVVTRSYLQQQPDVVENVLKVFLEATAFLHKPANREIVLRLLSDKLKISATTAAKETLQDIDKLIARRPYPDLEGLKNIQRVMRYNPSVARVKVEDLVDERIYRKLEESQFIDRLYR
jgi:ABC-type nitrate/sulfonate/bicarbonate transport system substrate-binding protein